MLFLLRLSSLSKRVMSCSPYNLLRFCLYDVSHCWCLLIHAPLKFVIWTHRIRCIVLCTWKAAERVINVSLLNHYKKPPAEERRKQLHRVINHYVMLVYVFKMKHEFDLNKLSAMISLHHLLRSWSSRFFCLHMFVPVLQIVLIWLRLKSVTCKDPLITQLPVIKWFYFKFYFYTTFQRIKTYLLIWKKKSAATCFFTTRCH